MILRSIAKEKEAIHGDGIKLFKFLAIREILGQSMY
jgi:hypothetical protein